MRKILLCFLAFWLAPAGWAAPLILTFDSTGITASGASASGEVAWVGVARVPRQYYQEVFEVRKSVAADAAGTATLSLEGPAPQRSIWVAVDVVSGTFVVGTPEDYPMLEEPLTPSQLAFDTENRAAGLQFAQQQAQLLLVRPGVGAWSLRAIDGMALDADGQVNTAVAVDLAELEPLGTTPAPTTLQAGDVVVMIDPNRFTHTVATVAASLLTPGGN